MKTTVPVVICLSAFVFIAEAEAQDRGTGIPTSRFGTYVARGELLVNPFFAYTTDHNREYQPAQLGYGLVQDYRARFRSTEGILLVAYGVTDRLDVEGQVRMRLVREEGRRPEMFGFFEVTLPSHKNKKLIGDPDWDLRPGIGFVRGFAWGTMTTRITVEYNHDDHLWDLGEFSIEYLKRL